MKQRKHRRIYEYILIIAIILGLDGLFLLRYNFFSYNAQMVS